MRRDWEEYHTQPVKRGHVLVDPDILGTQPQHRQTEKLGRPSNIQCTEDFKRELCKLVDISKVETGRFIEEENITIQKGNRRLMFIKAFYGRKPYWKEWIELFHIEPEFFRSELEEELYRVISKYFRRVFVEYYEDRQTLKELQAGIPPENTRLGSKLRLLGYRFFRDWYYPEGWMEGGYKLQAEK